MKGQMCVCLCVSVSVLNPLKKNGLSVRNIGKLQVAFLFAVLLLMSIYLCVPSLALSGFGFVKVYMDLPLRINKPKQKEGILHCYRLEITCNNSHNSTRPSK